MDAKIWRIILLLQKSRVGNFIVSCLYNCGIIFIYNFFVYEKERKNPTLEMQASKNYFEYNKNRVDNVAEMMEDDVSKKIYKAAVKYRITHDRKDRPAYNRKNQYFPDDIVELTNEEVFVDCGAYNGDTINTFVNKVNQTYKKIVAFEADKANAKLIRTKENIHVVCAAVWNENTELLFSNGGGSSSRVSNDTGMKVNAVAIDTISECKEATYIKMDVEGSEYNALIGAQKTISMNRPKLAICIYHSDEDMVRIAELIQGWSLNYKFYVRHHAQKISETVLYCIPS